MSSLPIPPNNRTLKRESCCQWNWKPEQKTHTHTLGSPLEIFPTLPYLNNGGHGNKKGRGSNPYPPDPKRRSFFFWSSCDPKPFKFTFYFLYVDDGTFIKYPFPKYTAVSWPRSFPDSLKGNISKRSFLLVLCCWSHFQKKIKTKYSLWNTKIFLNKRL